MARSSRALFLILICLPLGSLVAQSSRAKVATTPDFLQTDPDAGFARSGEQYCAPTAVSNSLMWLAANGYDDLRPAGRAKAAQIRMIKTLAGADYMNTSPTSGTDAAQLITGVAAYLKEHGYAPALRYDGWRPVPEDNLVSEYPELEVIREIMAEESGAAWLNVGWYIYDEESGEYERRGGHWVTVVGFVGDDLLIHDPSPGTGAKKWTQRIFFTEIEEGTLTGNQPNLPRDAAGYLEVGGEMRVGRGYTCIVDGVVSMTME
jgi:hypothetical protein